MQTVTVTPETLENAFTAYFKTKVDWIGAEEINLIDHFVSEFFTYLKKAENNDSLKLHLTYEKLGHYLCNDYDEFPEILRLLENEEDHTKLVDDVSEDIIVWNEVQGITVGSLLNEIT